MDKVIFDFGRVMVMEVISYLVIRDIDRYILDSITLPLLLSQDNIHPFALKWLASWNLQSIKWVVSYLAFGLPPRLHYR